MNTQTPAPAKRRGLRKSSAAKAAARFQIASRRREVAALYRQGLQQKEIAERLGVSEATICADVAHLKSLLTAGSVEDIRETVAEERAALDDDEGAMRELLLQTLSESPNSTSQKAVIQSYQMILSIMRRRAALLGLDGAARTQNEDNSELDAILARLEGE